MPSVATLENLIAVKTALAEKYFHFSNTAGSRPKRLTYRQKSVRYARQATTIRQLVEQKSAAAQ